MMVLTFETNTITAPDGGGEERKIGDMLTDADAVSIGNAFLHMGEALPEKALVSCSTVRCDMRAHRGRTGIPCETGQARELTPREASDRHGDHGLRPRGKSQRNVHFITQQVCKVWPPSLPIGGAYLLVASCAKADIRLVSLVEVICGSQPSTASLVM